MILRVWRGYASPATAEAYPRHLLETVRPKLARLGGFRGLYLLRRNGEREVEYEVLTLWDSMAAVRAFAGATRSVQSWSRRQRRRWSATTPQSRTTTWWRAQV